MLYSYNAFKFQAQDGDLKRQLSPIMHMLLASCAGKHTLNTLSLTSYALHPVGILTLSLTNPVWVVKTRLCLPDTENVPSNMRYKGLRGIYTVACLI